MEFSHISVLLSETIESLSIKPDGIYIDGTAGGGGHSAHILENLSDKGTLVMIDRDPDAIETVTKRFAGKKNVIIKHGRFADIKEIAASEGIKSVDGILLDIGVSSFQLDSTMRGFSYHNDAPLDMRMSKEGTSAYDIVNTLSQNELRDIIENYGEDKFAFLIAKKIIEKRAQAPIKTTLELAEIIKEAVPAKVRRQEKHPARKTFQALRIAVNGELDELSDGLDGAFELLNKGGRLSVITFHSLEDRIVKQKMNDWCKGCTCPPDFPVCVCGNKPKVKLVYKKGIVPTEKEQEENMRARSARLRVCEKL